MTDDFDILGDAARDNTDADESSAAAAGGGRLRLPLPLISMVVIVALVAAIGAWGVVNGAENRTKDVERVSGLDNVLAPPDGDDDNSGGDGTDDGNEAPVGTNAEGESIFDDEVAYPARNYLLVGSDSREGADADAEDAGVIGDTGDVGGQRSDTLMILRQEANGPASLLSIPRDLWVEIAGEARSNRINAAFNDGPLTLVATVTESLGIPVHHYIEVDFFGFKDIINELGGVEVCVGNESRDTHVGLHIPAGCSNLSGDEALAFARSRYFQEWDGDSWQSDPTGDRGRVIRQQLFMRAAVDGALRKIRESPFSAGDTLEVIIDSVKIDDSLDPIKAAQALRQAAEDGLSTYVLPTYDDQVGDAAVLQLAEGSELVLDYFQGTGDLPPEEYLTGSTDEAAAPAAGSTPPTSTPSTTTADG